MRPLPLCLGLLAAVAGSNSSEVTAAADLLNITDLEISDLSSDQDSTVKRSIGFHNHGEGPKAPTRAFSWLKVPTGAFTFKDTIKTLLRHYTKQTLTPW